MTFHKRLFVKPKQINKCWLKGSGCGAVGRVVASCTRGPGFESSHRQLLLNIYLLLTVCRKNGKRKKKEAANGPFIKNKCWLIPPTL